MTDQNIFTKAVDLRRRKRLVVLKCYCLWSWLSHHDPSDKSLYPVRELLAPKRFHYCTLCEYSRSTIYGNPDCSGCPMLDRWPSTTSLQHHVARCMDLHSIYRHWSKESTLIKDRLIVAGDVAQALWKLYKKLEEK